MSDTPDFKLIDKRVAQRHMKTGLIDEKQYEKYLKTLPDVAEKAESVASNIYDPDDSLPEAGAKHQ